MAMIEEYHNKQKKPSTLEFGYEKALKEMQQRYKMELESEL